MHASTPATNWPERPRLPLSRPHTVHAASEYPHVAFDEEAEGQTTPRRASVARSLGQHPQSEADLTHSFTTGITQQSSTFTRDYSSQPQGQRATRRRTSPRTWSFSLAASSSAAAAAASATNLFAAAHGHTTQGQSKTTSLGRRFSRKYADKMADLKENLQRHAQTMPSRIRRASTLHNNDLNAPTPPPPVSPSKRNARQVESRPKKLRAALLGLGDRKDTPAPAYSMSQSKRQNSPTMVNGAGGGGGKARQAAALKHGLTLDDENFWHGFDDFNSRRLRLGSLSSAADSGADLSTYGGSQCQDRDGDVEMLDREVGYTAPNFMTTLPREICLQIFENLDAETLLRTEHTSKSWRMLVNETSVWRSAFYTRYQRVIHTDPAPVQVGGAGLGRPNRPQQSWKKMYKARNELEANWRRGRNEAGKAIYLSGHTDSVYCLQFDEEKIITGSRDRTIRVWDINTFQCIKVIGGPNVRPVLGPKVLRTVDYPAFHLATASVNGTAYGESIYHVPTEWHDASILCLQYDDQILVTGSSDSDLLIWDIHTYQPIKRLRKHTGGVLDVALDSKHIVSCSKDSRIIVWDRKTFEPKGDLTGHRGPVNAVQLRGKWLVSASGDGIARLWDLDEMKLAKEFSAKERGLAAVEFSEDTRYVLAGGNDHITYKFDTQTGREVKQFTGHTQLVRSLWLDSANRRVVSGSYDLDLRVYDFETGEELWRAEEWTTSWMLAAKSDYRRIVATSQDGRILVVDFGLHKGGREDGEKIKNLDLLRGMDHTTAIVFRNPWTSATI